jgi:thioredoxin-related protein
MHSVGIATFFLLFFFVKTGNAQDTLKFIDLSDYEHDIDDFLSRVENEDQFLLVYFSGDGCRPCLKMKREVFTNSKVIQASKKILRLQSHLILKPYPMPAKLSKKVNRNHYRLGRRLDHDGSYPSFFLVNSVGDVVAQAGSMSSEEFIAFVTQ